MRKPGSPGAPTAANFKRAAKTARKTQEAESLMAKPRKGKAKVKITASGKRSVTVAGKAKVRPGTSKGDSYCSRSYVA